MSQRPGALVLATVGGIASVASVLAAEAFIAVAAFMLLILGSTLAIGTVIAADRSDPAGRGNRLQLVTIVASPAGDGGAPNALQPVRTPEVAMVGRLAGDDETGQARACPLASTGGRR